MKDSKAVPAQSEVILSHFRKEAAEEGACATSTMRDQITRGREIEAVRSTWYLVVTERCIINVMDRDGQVKSFSEDELAQLNEARAELGLPPIAQPHHNLWFDKDWFLEIIGKEFEVIDTQAVYEELPPTNFLSSHCFISRAQYPAVTKTDIMYNTHLVKFFSFLPPMGLYSRSSSTCCASAN